MTRPELHCGSPLRGAPAPGRSAGWGRVLLVLLALVPVLGLAAPALEAQERRLDANGLIRGVVLDLTTGDPIVEVAVRLYPPGGAEPILRTTDVRGRFFFPLQTSGSYGFELFRIGYGTVRDSIHLEEGAEVDVVAELALEAIAMEAVVVSTTRRSRLDTNGFFDRRRTLSGRFITREDIENRRPMYLADLFRSVPSLRVTPLANGQGSVITGRGGCFPTYYLDGVRLVESASLDMFIPPDNLEGLEIYGSSSSPPQYQGGRCGTVVMWSRTPGGSTGTGSWWKKLLVAGGFVVGVLLLTR
jgi:hypothetical protein